MIGPSEPISKEILSSACNLKILSHFKLWEFWSFLPIWCEFIPRHNFKSAFNIFIDSSFLKNWPSMKIMVTYTWFITKIRYNLPNPKLENLTNRGPLVLLFLNERLVLHNYLAIFVTADVSCRFCLRAREKKLVDYCVNPKFWGKFGLTQ